MSLLALLSKVALVGALAVAAFLKYASFTCQNFHIDFSQAANKVIVVTGANSGLGYHTAVALAKANSKVILACRSAERCEKAKESILKDVPTAHVESMSLDLSSFQSIHDFVAKLRTKHEEIDVLVNNAGIMALPTREVTKDGLEAQVGTNHFGHFLLTALVYPILAKNGRIINHSSSAHMFGQEDFVTTNLQSELSYDPWVTYGNSKLANLYFTYELNRRLQAAGNPRNIKSIAVHPGYTATNLQAGRFPLWEYANSLVAMKGEDGALSQIYGK